MRVSSTMHDDNWNSEKPQPYFVERGSNVDLTCTAKDPGGSNFGLYEIIWFLNLTLVKIYYCTNVKQSPVETCNLTLRGSVGEKYTCKASNRKGCTYKELELKVTGESRLIQVINSYYIIIIGGPMLTNFACIALRRLPGNIMRKHAKDLP